MEEKIKKKAAADKTKQNVGGRPDEHCRPGHYRSWGEAESTRRAGEIKGRLCAETRASTPGCVHAVRVAWLEGKDCAEELWEQEKPAKVKCVCVGWRGSSDVFEHR